MGNNQEKKKQMLLIMKKEIKDLERQIKYNKLINIKNSIMKNTLINTRRLQYIAPFILTASILAGGSKILGFGFPFYGGDTKEEYLHIKKEFDSTGNVRYEEQYGEFSNMTNLINYYSKWERTENGFYTRNVQIYHIHNISYEKLEELFLKEKVTINDIFGEPISSYKERKNYLTDEEANKNEYIQATIYKKDTNDYIIIKESLDDNIETTLLYILVTIFAEILPAKYRSKISKFNYSSSVRKIKEKYEKIDAKKQKMRLEIKRENYNRLVK